MREILFRGKRIDNGEWVYGHYYTQGFQLDTIEEDWYHLIKPIGSVSWVGDRVIPETVGQYTGSTDKNGKKIFEGDICKHRSNYSGDFVISVVTYTDGQFLAMADNNSGFNLSDKLEVIGNIHDNSLEDFKDEK